MELGEKIYQLRKAQNMTLEELGEKVGVGKSTVRKWENGSIANMRRDKIAKLADALNVSPAYLMDWPEREVKQNGNTIPILGRVVAGYPVEEFSFKEGELAVPKDISESGEYFGLQIHGDSMSPAILDGDCVIVHKQEDAESGEIVIATINGDDATCKRLRKYKDGIELISNNPSYEPFEFSKKEVAEKPVRIIGKVVELRRKF